MSSPAEDDIYALHAKITALQSTIRQLKKDGGNPQEVMVEVEKLNEYRKRYAELSASVTGDVDEFGYKKDSFSRRAFDELLLRKMYVVRSFEIHNGPAGLFDYGPPACALKSNVLSLWRNHFVLEENMLEMECTNLTPSSVLEASGHVERFTDFMVKDEKTGECFRADKLLEEVIDNYLAANPLLTPKEKEEHLLIQRQADAFSADELYDMLMKYNTKSPTNPEHDITRPFPFNLMFKTTIGPEGTSVGYLRPETAQGLFVNFK